MRLNVKGGTGVIVKAGNRDIYDLYLREIIKYKPLSREEEYETFIDYRKNNNLKAKEKIQNHNLLFVVSVARKYTSIVGSNTLSLEDLINEGNIGLINAIDKFDYSSGFKFITYAVWYIKQQILISIDSNNKNIRIPKNMRNQLNQFTNERKRLEQELGRDVSNIEVFDSLYQKNVLAESDTIEKFERLIVVDAYELSLNTTVTDDQKVELAELLVSDEYNPLTEVEKFDTNQILKDYLDEIPNPFRTFIIKYYGLFGHSKMTYKEIGNEYDISPITVKTKIDSHLKWLCRRKKGFGKFFY